MASAHVQALLVGLRDNVVSTIEGADGASEQAVVADVTDVIYSFELSVNADSSLSQLEKQSLAGAITLLYGQVGNIVHDYIYTYDIPPDQTRTQSGFWKKFGRIAGSIVLCMAVGAVACGIIAGALVLAGATTALALPATITVAGINFTVTALSMAIGGAPG